MVSVRLPGGAEVLICSFELIGELRKLQSELEVFDLSVGNVDLEGGNVHGSCQRRNLECRDEGMKSQYFVILMRLQILQRTLPRPQDGALEVRAAELTCGMINASVRGRSRVAEPHILVDHGWVKLSTGEVKRHKKHLYLTLSLSHQPVPPVLRKEIFLPLLAI